jgi:hypothetical protein
MIFENQKYIEYKSYSINNTKKKKKNPGYIPLLEKVKTTVVNVDYYIYIYIQLL